ncbi:MAG: phosphatase [Chlamydiae bacterium CG10_big_fil_rev_8_21_14_0_10_42_34]|nr:MAG: phosphatase [Chlamydiae bacterium CG10_big_fil_rev_8_21_14_0_10_42_34]
MPNDFRADLHCHSTCSDGSDPPEVLLRLAKEVGLKGLSITDHDTIAAYTPELFAEAQTLGIQLLPGMEISSELEGTSVHILGYGFDVHSQKLNEFLTLMQTKRNERNRGILKRLADRKMVILEEELKTFAANRSIGRPHIAQLMVRKGYVKTEREAFDHYLREGGLCYTSGIKFTPKEVIEQIHLANGKAVLAHPHFIKKHSFLKKLLDLPFDGIECYYSMLAKAQELPWVKLAKDKDLIATGGSDYHGEIKPHIRLGSSWVNEEIFEQLKASDR